MWRRIVRVSLLVLVFPLATACSQRGATVPNTAGTQAETLPMPEANGVFLFSGGEYLELRGSIQGEPPTHEARLPARLIVYPPAGWITSDRRLSDFTGQKPPYRATVAIKHFYKPLGNGLFEVIPSDGFQPNRIYGLGISIGGELQWWYFTFTK